MSTVLSSSPAAFARIMHPNESSPSPRSSRLIAAGRAQEGQQVNANALRLARTDHPEFQKSLIEVLEGRYQGNVGFVL
jgi:hypothetical protein